MKYSFEDVKLFTWYEDVYQEYPFIVYEKALPNNIEVIMNHPELTGGWTILNYDIKFPWELKESEWRPNRRQRKVLVKHIFKHSGWFRR